VTLGSGAFIGNTTYAAPNFSAKFTVFLAHGTIRATLTGTGTLHPDGSASSTGSGKVTGGTDTYKGSKGTFTLTGTTPANGPRTVLRRSICLRSSAGSMRRISSGSSWSTR